MQENEKILHLFEDKFKTFETVNGIPWCFTNSREKFLEWTIKTKQYFDYESSLLKPLQNKLSNKLYSGYTKKRLQKYLDHKNSHLKTMEKVLKPFIQGAEDLKGHTIISDKQNILSYQDLLFRDWDWGQEEIEQYSSYILKNLTGEEKNILVLGGGASGLSYHLASKVNANIISTDINPYLVLSSQKIINNCNLKTYEFLDAPSDIAHYSRKVEIVGRDNLPNHFQIFSDFNDMPFKTESFDVIIGCWFYDIIDLSLDKSIAHANTFLKEQGNSIFIGPQNFHKNQLSTQLTPEEIIEEFFRYFTKVDHQITNTFYLKNPNSSAYRNEKLLFLKASGIQSASRLKLQEDDSFKMSQELSIYKQKIDIFSKILKHVEKDMTYEELGVKLESEFEFSKDEALYYAKSFMKKILLEI
jgi:ubiquinone/menaquinone biosynthesis C-methylase UbiE